MAHSQTPFFWVSLFFLYVGSFYFYFESASKKFGIFLELIGLLLYILFLVGYSPATAFSRVLVVILPVFIWFYGKVAAEERHP